jgi:D-hydroxyproline dehydrogenase subunit alpha
VREAVRELGAGDLRTVKLLTRAGMGWCQGRVCEPGVAGVAGCAQTAVRRPFARPVPLGVLARAGEDGESAGETGQSGESGESEEP